MVNTVKEQMLLDLLGDVGVLSQDVNDLKDRIASLPLELDSVVNNIPTRSKRGQYIMLLLSFVTGLVGCTVGSVAMYLMLGGKDVTIRADIGQAVLDNWDALDVKTQNIIKGG